MDGPTPRWVGIFSMRRLAEVVSPYTLSSAKKRPGVSRAFLQILPDRFATPLSDSPPHRAALAYVQDALQSGS